ncbi:Kelch repeat-containing protein [Truepera radiovictrix]|uniref:Kelch repeat-containing protein n=1 Tax=Truepera radiovictrix TaxID=332249 RepID=UPI00281631EF|nr:kelch repeat-containing protein [Truepera radiovictrix]WMT57069.1 kelch repeat-containing protein [Truepera radiovictrix]
MRRTDVKKLGFSLSALTLLGVLGACERDARPPVDPPAGLTIETLDAAPLSATAGEPVTFSWRVRGADASALRCTLDVTGDGAPDYTFEGEACLSGSQEHTYAAPGTFSPTLRVAAGGESTSRSGPSVTVTGASGNFTTLTWSPAAPQPIGVAEAQGRALNGKLYVFGGFDKEKRCCTPTDRAQVYDPETDTWTPLAPLPPMNNTGHGGVTHAGMATDGTDFFFAGGYTANNSGTGQIFGTKEVWRYNVAEDSYTRLPDLPVERSAGQLEYLDGRLHYFGGSNLARTQDTPEHFVLDLAGGAQSWTEAAPLPNPRNHMGSAVLGGRIYAVAGQHDHDHNLVTQNDVHAYDPETDTWETLAPLPKAVSHISNSTFAMGGRIIVVGGEIAHLKPITDVFAYDPETDTWTSLTDLPHALQSAVADEINGEIFLTGGSGGGWRAETYRATPQD